MQNRSTIRKILFEYFKGSATSVQKKWIEEWVKQSNENEELFYQYLEEWERINPQYIADSQLAFENFVERLNHPSKSTFSLKTSVVTDPSNFRYYLFAAASIVIVLMFAWSFRDPILNKTFTTRHGEIKMIVLSDGTHVNLNANSILKVRRSWLGESQRLAFLDGEAFFDVSYHEFKKFKIRTDNQLEVVVHGTEFNMYTRHKTTQVVLKKGKVELVKYDDLGSNSIFMKPGEMIRLEPDGNLNKTQVVEPDQYSSWKDHRYIFDKTSLRQIGNMIFDNYGLNVIVNDTVLNDLTVSGSFTAIDVDDFANSVAQVLDIKFQREGDTIFFSD
ncbi:MAG: FecR domain-containing protein [Cyclobacteriaceae bacterium]|nr:FecR domain-containing protein [Cyclobacteriaceae bacterium]